MFNPIQSIQFPPKRVPWDDGVHFVLQLSMFCWRVLLGLPSQRQAFANRRAALKDPKASSPGIANGATPLTPWGKSVWNAMYIVTSSYIHTYIYIYTPIDTARTEVLPGEEKSCSKLDPSRAKLGPSCELSGPRWAQVMHIKWTKDGFCSKQVHTALLPCHPPLGGPGPSGRNSAVSADNKQTMESSFPNLHMSMQF